MLTTFDLDLHLSYHLLLNDVELAWMPPYLMILAAEYGDM